ncbi:MAG: M1 family metallopeptidase [Thermoanaerobaculia bacterium]|nr:M1 family metallopeptidase [Thermoanaerobaculia bacterium]
MRFLRFRALCLTVLVMASPVLGVDPPVLFETPLSPRIANYAIEVRLDPDLRMIHGKETLTWINKSPVAIDELQFHLYLNGFRNSEANFMRESGGRMRGAALDDNGWGFIEIDRISLPKSSVRDRARLGRYASSLPGMLTLPEVSLQAAAAAGAVPSRDEETTGPLPLNQSAVDLTEAMEFIRPDDGNLHDDTVFRLPLPTALAPGETIVVEFDFHAQLPTPPFARTGAKEEYFFVGQWFPKIAVHTGEAWNAHQFHYNSEFFADFGVYDVDITVPLEYVVGATGQEFERIDHGDGTATHRYHAEDVHDFAWTASPDYVVYETTADDVAIRVLMQKDNLATAALHLEATQKVIRHFQATWGDYPFPNFTVVDPRRGADGSGGMEYPTLVTAVTPRGSFPGLSDLAIETVIVHEFGHNYWYHMLASNEFEESWMDEGINTYTDIRTAEEAFSDRDLFGLEIDMGAFNRFFLAGTLSDPVKTMAWETADRGSYSTNSYSRPGVILETLRGYLGPERMNRVMRAYYEEWRFRHPTSEDFFAVANEASGENLDWFFDQAFYGTANLDYSVTDISRQKVEERGYDFDRPVTEPWDGEGDFAVGGPEEDGGDEGDSEGDDKDASDGSEDDADDDTVYKSSVLVERLGDFEFPVRLQVVFDDGTVAEESWDGVDRWKRFEWTGTHRVSTATVDPEGWLALDSNHLNNGRTFESKTSGVQRVVEGWRFAAEILLDLLSF